MDCVKGFFDLCINNSAIDRNYDNTIKILYKYGYRTIAINYVIDEEEFQKSLNKQDSQGKKKRKGDKSNESEKSILPSVIDTKPVKGCESMTILTRLTIHLATKDFYFKIAKLPEFKHFQIVAILPLNSIAFTVACGEVEADILTLSTVNKCEYKMLRKHYNQFLSRGFYLELLYAPAITEDSSRRLVLASAHHYHVVGKSRNVIISSGINASSQIRNPYDIVNLGLIFGLNQAQSKMAVMQNCRNVYYHAVSRRYGKVSMLASFAVVAKRNNQPEEGCTPMDDEDSVILLEDDKNDDGDVVIVEHKLKKIKT